MKTKLSDYGWTRGWEEKFGPAAADGFRPGRVVFGGKGVYRVAAEDGEGFGRVSGAFGHLAAGTEDFPAVGDWVAVENTGNPREPYRIHRVIPRRSEISRRAPGRETEKQVLAANVDIVFVMLSLEGGRKCSPRAAERYAAAACESGARPVFLLNKADISDDPDGAAAEIRGAAPGSDVILMSCASGTGTEAAAAVVSPGETAVLLGPSGTGKSTFINLLLGYDRQKTGDIRRGDMKGRHTTTSRELFLLPGGGMIIDTPGLREFQVWAGDDALEDSFADIAGIAGSCRFRDCTHTNEPGCAVLAALENGSLDAGRYENFLKLSEELAYLARKTDERAQAEHEKKWKSIAKSIRGWTKESRHG